MEERRGSCDLLPSNYLELVFASFIIKEDNKCFGGLITFVILVSQFSQLNLKRLAIKMFEVLLVTLVVVSPQLENFYFPKVERKLN